MEEKTLTLEQEQTIKKRAHELKTEKKLRKVYPMVVFGDTDCEEKEIYVVYLSEPTDRKSTRLNSSHRSLSRMPSSA